jgi:hypothetical protein
MGILGNMRLRERPGLKPGLSRSVGMQQPEGRCSLRNNTAKGIVRFAPLLRKDEAPGDQWIPIKRIQRTEPQRMRIRAA